MVSKNQLKQILKLKHKKYRTRFGYFVAEGEKIVNDLINSSWHAQSLYSLEDNFHPKAIKIDSSVMKKISHLKTPSPVLGVFKIPNKVKTKPSLLTIAIDKLIDPGNLGSIIRLCDWFGIDDLICSLDTVDCYNPKVIQATMGSISRVNITYSDLNFLINKSKNLVLADMKGIALKKYNFKKDQIIFFGNESEGISNHLKKVISESITIKKYGDKIDSLNVSNSVAIVLSHLNN